MIFKYVATCLQCTLMATDPVATCLHGLMLTKLFLYLRITGIKPDVEIFDACIAAIKLFIYGGIIGDAIAI